MYDTVDFKLKYQFSEKEMDVVGSKLDEPKESYSAKYGYSVQGYCNKAKVFVNSRCLKIDKTSIPRIVKGSNHLAITLEDTKDYVSSLSDSLSVNMNHAEVSRFHFNHDVKTDELPMQYCLNFVSSPSREKSEFQHGVYFTGKSNQSAYYDKVVEMKKKHYKGLDLEGVNMLRAENRFNKRVKEQFKKFDMKASVLWDHSFYNHQVNLIADNYFKIKKKKQNYMKLPIPEKPKDLFNALFIIGLENVGEESLIITLNEWYNQDLITYSDKYRMIQRIQERYSKVDYQQKDLIEELDKKFEQARQEYLI